MTIDQALFDFVLGYWWGWAIWLTLAVAGLIVLIRKR